jgi:hypothetical protein
MGYRYEKRIAAPASWHEAGGSRNSARLKVVRFPNCCGKVWSGSGRARASQWRGVGDCRGSEHGIRAERQELSLQLTIGSYLTLPTLDPINKSNFDVFLPKIASSPTSHRCSLNPELRNTTVLLLPSIFCTSPASPLPGYFHLQVPSRFTARPSAAPQRPSTSTSAGIQCSDFGAPIFKFRIFCRVILFAGIPTSQRQIPTESPRSTGKQPSSMRLIVTFAPVILPFVAAKHHCVVRGTWRLQSRQDASVSLPSLHSAAVAEGHLRVEKLRRSYCRYHLLPALT